jgi:transcriptional regulator with XRE-family HTH domain
MAFVIRKLDNGGDTIGAKLYATRKLAGWTLSEMAAKTKVQKTVLDAFEKDAYDRLPAPIYARQYLKTYAKALGVDPEYYLRRFDDERGTCDLLDHSRLPIERTRASHLFVQGNLLKVAGFASILLLVAGYLGWEVRHIVSPPSLAVTSPTDGFTTDEASVHITGVAETDAAVKVNGQAILTKADGSFDTEVMLERGMNLITVEGAKRYSKTATEYRRVILEHGSGQTASIGGAQLP